MRRLVIAAVAIGASAASVAPAQVFRSDTEGVRVSVLATEDGRPIPALRAADFELRDNGVLQRVEVAPMGGPIGLTLVLDVSASVDGEPLQNLTSAADSVLTALRHGDRAALITFAAAVDLLSLPTTDLATIRQKLRATRTMGTTSLVDATAAAIVLADRGTDPALILLFSDGQDNTSWLQAASVEEDAARSESVVYGVTLHSPQRRSRGANRFLDRVAAATGGAVEYAESPENITRTFLRVLDEFRQRYVLTYVPTDAQPRGGWHDLDIRLRGRSGKVKARRGYWAAHR